MKLIPLTDGITQIITESPDENIAVLSALTKERIQKTFFKNSIFVSTKTLNTAPADTDIYNLIHK